MPAQFPIRTRSRVKDSRPFAFGVYSLPSVGGIVDGYPPALDLNFLTDFVDPRITYSGGTNGTRINSVGTIVAATTPRFDYNPVTWVPLGLLIEEARTNLLLNSLLNGTSLSTQSVTTTNVAHTLSFYGTGTVTLTGTSTAGPAVGGGSYPTRTTLTFTPTAGSLTLTVSGSVQFANLEVGSFASSFIPTAGATVTRAVDSATMTGSNFSSWYNSSSGAMATSFDRLQTSVNAYFWALSDGTFNNNIVGFSFNGAGLTVATATVTQAAITPSGGNLLTGVLAASAWAVDDFAACVDGGTLAVDLAGTIPTVDRLRIGGAPNATAPINGHIRRLRYWSGRLSDSKLQSLQT